MKRLMRIVASVMLMAVLGAVPANADEGFGLKDLSLSFIESGGAEARKAGSHPFAAVTTINVNTADVPGQGELPIDAARDLVVKLPAGFIGDPRATPRCSGADFADVHPAGAVDPGYPSCPNSTAVGLVHLRIGFSGGGPETTVAPVYNLEPPPGVAGKLGFIALGVPVTLEVGVNPDPPYNLIVSANQIAQPVRFFGAELTIWGNPASATHDAERGTCLSGVPCSSGVAERPFLTLPRSCPSSLQTLIQADSWQNPGQWLPPYLIQTPGPVDCAKLGFGPRLEAQPTTDQVESPSGLDVSLTVEDDGLLSPEGRAKSDIKKAVVTLPEGVTANPSLAEGLLTCSEADLARERVDSEAGEGCPQASTIGSVEVETPILEGEILKGQLFIASPYQNPFGSLLALYVVIKHPGLGILVKVPGEIEPDPRTGQLVTTFGEAPYELPQFPLSQVRFHLREGGRSPLISPATCGSYTTVAEFTPWSNPAGSVRTTSSFVINRGVGGAPCPAGRPFDPGFSGGSVSNSAGSHSPFLLRMTRRDGDQDLTRFDATLPPGVAAKLAGVGRCPEAAIAQAKAQTGRAELASPSCPAGSKIGSVWAGAGVGSQLTYVPGSVYLAGPFGGAPISVVGVVPAVAGPFDVGTVVVRQGVVLDPVTAEVKVDGARSDPIPHMLAGIPLKVRDIRVSADRPEFTLNPTSCNPFEVRADIWGGGADPFSSSDDAAAARSARFQAANCDSLAFKPRLSLQLKGGTGRGDYPALRAVVRPRKGNANIRRTSVALPQSAFLAQEHIRTICTRVQFAADTCPKGSVYGHARAVSPLLDEPLSGPVYLRSSSNPLPDMVVGLHGQFEIDLVGRIDSINGGIRSTFATVPDAPISKFVLDMKGGAKGLLVNSRNLCAGPVSRATVKMSAQNGKARNFRAPLQPKCGRR